MSPRKNARYERLEKGEYKKILANIASSMKKYLVPLLIALIVMIASVCLNIYLPTVTKELTDIINDGAASKSIDMEQVLVKALTGIALICSGAVFNLISGMVLVTVTMRYAEQLRKQIASKINRIPLRYFDSTSIGDILSRVTNDVDQLSQSMQQTISTMVSSLFTLVGVIIMMFVTSWQLALTIIATLPLMAVLMIFIIKIAGPWFQKRQDGIGVIEGVCEENFNGQMVIKLFNAEKTTDENFENVNQGLGKTLFKSEIYGGLMQPLMNFVSYVAYALVCLVGGMMIANNAVGVTLGTITAFLTYVNQFQSPLTQIAQAMNNMQSGMAAGKRVFEFLGVEEMESEEGKEPKLLEDGVEKVRGEVVFDHVSFSYDETREIIHDFSARIQPGMKVAIVGPTGAGKTTMVNLLMRFYEIQKGKITIDGVDIKEMPKSELHAIFAMVLQDTWVFEGTLRDNLAYNNTNLTEDDFNQAVKSAHMVHFVRSLPGGLDYQIKANSEISGGQKQQITIARAMLKDSSLVILDEATSNVDTRTEEKIQEAMDRLTKGKTSFVIAHRLSTIKNADLILVMKDGNIVEQGTHEELIEKGGFYYSLYNSQFALAGENLID